MHSKTTKLDRDYYTAHHCLCSVISLCFENLKHETFLKISTQPAAISNFEKMERHIKKGRVRTKVDDTISSPIIVLCNLFAGKQRENRLRGSLGTFTYYSPLQYTGCSNSSLYVLNSSCDLDFELWVN